MTADALPGAYPARPATAGAVFSLVLIAATVLPLATIALAALHPFAVPVVLFLAALGSTHVLATAYLFTDPSVRGFVRAHPVKMVLAPALLMAGGMALFTWPSNPVFVLSVLALFLYQSWHFGAQNIGVATFVSLADRGRPLAAREKLAIKAGIVVGMVGILHAMAPAYMIGAEYMPVAAPVAAAIDFGFRIGCAAAWAVVAVAAWMLVQAWRQQKLLHGVAVALSMTFLLPMYFTTDPAMGFFGFLTAHGVQYVVFLFAHSVSPGLPRTAPQRWWAWAAAPIALLACMVVGWKVWADGPAVGTASLPLVGTAFILSVSLVHFWMDQFLWRMKDRARAEWLRARFGYVLSRSG